MKVMYLMFNRATKYLEKKNYTKALSFFKKQIADREFKELYLNMGNTYKALGDDKSALKCYLTAFRDEMPYADGSFGPYSLALNNIGLLEYSLGNNSSATSFYKAALTLDPLYGEAVWNLSIATLKETNCLVGWDMYEYRFNRGAGSVRIDNSISRWDGHSSGSRIVVLTEQGFGDKIMFGRYLSYLRFFFTDVVVCCAPELDRLYAPYTCVRNTDGFTVSVPLCSLAGRFGIVPENWLDGKFVAHDFADNFNIGVVNTGSPTHANDRNRSCPSNYMSALSSYGTLYSLSPGAKIAKATTLNPASWAETASYLLGLDVVVSVDTSIVHLAGTLGVPCIMVQPLKETDFRWGNAGVQNVWYPSVTVIPNDNDWEVAFSKVHERIQCIEK